MNNRGDNGMEGEITVCDGNDSWEELEDEELHATDGGVNDRSYRSEGRVLYYRSLNVAASLDQARLSVSDIRGSHLHQESSSLSQFPHTENRANTAGLDAAHGPLPSAETTRFLELLPGNGDPVECRLHSRSIPTGEFSYEAISYSSNLQGPEAIVSSCDDTHTRCDHSHRPDGDSRTEPVLCDGHEVHISGDLAHALTHLRLPNQSRLLWAAGLCVNTADVADRNHHTRIATTIFQHASRVIVSLGRRSFLGDQIEFASICKIVNIWRASCGLTDRIPPAEYFVQTSHFTQGNTLERGNQACSTKDAWLAAVEMFQKRWFSSAWSLTETATARSISFLLGDHEISWDWVGLAAAILRENYGRVPGIPPPDSGRHRRWVPEPGKVRSQSQSGKRTFPEPRILQAYFLYRMSRSQRFLPPLDLTFHELLLLSSDFGCKHEHDKVYTTYGIPTLDSMSSAIVPDYSKVVRTVYHEITLLFIRENHSVSFLAHVVNTHGWHDFIPGSRSSMPPLSLHGPSWVPHWHCKSREKIAPLQHCFAFSAGTKVPPKIRVSNDGSKMLVLGVIVDTVRSAFENRGTGTYWRGVEYQQTFPPQRERRLDEHLSNNKLWQSQLPSLALTLTCGKSWDGAPVSDLAMHVADYARCLLRGGLLWSISYASKPFATNQDDLSTTENHLTEQALEEISRGGNADRFLDAAATVGYRRSSFCTTGGLFGVGPDATYPGDVLCVIYGLGVPCILRKSLGPGGYTFIGECYVEEIMHGEVVTGLESNPVGGLKETWIQLE